MSDDLISKSSKAVADPAEPHAPADSAKSSQVASEWGEAAPSGVREQIIPGASSDNQTPVEGSTDTGQAIAGETSYTGSALASVDAGESGRVCEESVREQLKKVIDPELFVNIVDLGLVYVVDVAVSQEDPTKYEVQIEMTLTSPMCPAGPQLVSGCRSVTEAMSGVSKVEVKVVMDPPWTPDMMTEDARDQLNIF
ncbi:MAG: metal-sulfur cluster assembly factor [Pirellulaceae bacterium]|nr:metal-sulfur cluster assembly factor [Pirellulaceae bacterium]